MPIFLLLAIFRPKGEKLLPPPWPRAAHFFAIAIPTFILLGAIEYVLITNKQEKPAAQDWVIKSAAEQKTVWPLLEDIDISNKLKTGLWVVLMYHYDCPDCARAIPDYLEMHKSLAGNENAINFAFIEMPPYGGEKQQLISPDSNVTRGRLSDKKKWFFQTPVVVVLSDGAVSGAWEGKAPNLDEILNAAFNAEN
jgi:thiol-disulfide isomerase/thioredoxin